MSRKSTGAQDDMSLATVYIVVVIATVLLVTYVIALGRFNM